MNPNERWRLGKQSEPSSGLFSLFELVGTAIAPRYFKSLASSSGSKPEPSIAVVATATTGAKRDCRSEQVNAVEKNTGQNRMVDFTLESLLEFQHSQRVASAETRHPAIHDAFRKRPNYDNSRRRLKMKQHDRQSQLDTCWKLEDGSSLLDGSMK